VRPDGVIEELIEKARPWVIDNNATLEFRFEAE
jgi:hypothetical protein